MSDIVTERSGSAGLITLNRPKALNALSLPMIRDLLAAFQAWHADDEVKIVAIRGSNKIGRPDSPESRFGNFCAGGDIRFFYEAMASGDAAIEDFFTLEYTLNYLIHTYPKPVVAFMDGVVMGGGMGLSQGASVRIVTERTKMAMPETNIGLFPDVGGGYFLSRCPGHSGEYLALSGDVMGADEAIAFGLADVRMNASDLPACWATLAAQSFSGDAAAREWIATELVAKDALNAPAGAEFDTFFSLQDVPAIIRALESATTPWARKTAATLRKRSPLMLHVTLEQIRRARGMSLADELRMERDMVHQCFHRTGGAPSETVEGIRALAIDKDYQPKWAPSRIEDVTPQLVEPFFRSPWTEEKHPLSMIEQPASL
jgi:enoyl-CoA hydratase/carnithine racemase